MTFLKIGKEVIGLNVHLREEDIVCRYVLMKKKRNELMLLKWKEEISIDELDLLRDHPHINLLISGKGVVYKEAEEANQNSYDAKKIVAQKNGNHSLHLFRKDKLNEVLDLLSNNDVVPENIYLGESIAKHYEELEILTNQSAEKISFGDGIYTSSLKNALSAGLAAFISGDTSTAPLENFAFKKHENVLYKYRFFQGLKITGIVALLLLLVGFTVNSILSNKQKMLQANLISNRPQLVELQRLNKELEGKQELLEHNSWIRSSKMSFYLDQIAGHIPEGVVLDKWSVFTEKTNNVQIQGTANESSDFNEWIKKLKMIQFVEESSISFEYDEITAIAEGKGLFTITFDING